MPATFTRAEPEPMTTCRIRRFGNNHHHHHRHHHYHHPRRRPGATERHTQRQQIRLPLFAIRTLLYCTLVLFSRRDWQNIISITNTITITITITITSSTSVRRARHTPSCGRDNWLVAANRSICRAVAACPQKCFLPREAPRVGESLEVVPGMLRVRLHINFELGHPCKINIKFWQCTLPSIKLIRFVKARLDLFKTRSPCNGS